MQQRLLLNLLFLFVSTFGYVCYAQDETRQLIPEEFVKSRARKGATAPPKKAQYRFTESSNDKKTEAVKCTSANCRQLGLTVWKLRPGTAVENSPERIIVQDDANSMKYSAERMTSNAPISYGEKIRFSFEAQQDGYLYVIDREQYADGSTGTPILIFPTTRTRDGDNKVMPGRVIEIPAQDDHPNYFTLRRTRPDNVGELLTVIVAKQPIADIAITTNAQPLSTSQVDEWEQKWSGNTERFEMVGGAGLLWSKAEQQAGADRTRDLTQSDPGPQTIYRVAVKQDAPMLVKFVLRYRRLPKK